MCLQCESTEKTAAAPTFHIIYEDEQLVAIEKPSGILVHRTGISQDRVFVLQTLRNQLQKHVYTVHRLDRATSGVLLFALNKDSQAIISEQFEKKTIEKVYYAVVRGWIHKKGTIDHPVPNDKGKLKSAITHYQRMAKGEIDVAIGRYKTARYSLVKLMPETGRKHQIRRHLRSISHPVIGDVNYGDRHHNHYFWDHLNLNRLMLHAHDLKISHPVSHETLIFNSSLPVEWSALFQQLNWKMST